MKRTAAIMCLSILFIILITSCFSEKNIKPEKVRNEKTLQEFLIRGWNTWDNSNLLNHVYMPEGLSVKMSFRKNYKSGMPYFMNYAFIAGEQDKHSGQINPFLHYFDASYTDLKVSWEGLNARIQTATDYEDLLILYTPEKVSGHNHILILEAGILWGKQGLVRKMDNFIQAEIGNTVYSIRTTGADQKIPLPLHSPYLTFESDKEIAFFTGKTRSLELIKRIMVKRDERNRARSDKYGEMAEIWVAMHNVLAWNTIYDPFNQRLITPVNRLESENWGGFYLSGNDSYFTAAMFALDNKWRAYSNAIAITGNLTPEGFLPGYTGALPNSSPPDWSQPPAGSLICMLIYDKHKDKWFLKEVYDNLLTWNRWWDNARENRGYLSWGCGPGISGPVNSKDAAMKESGQYNSPLFNDVVFNPVSRKFELASVDLMSLYIADCKSLAEMADILGKQADKQELLARAEKYSIKLRELWDEETGFFRDKDLISNQFTNNISINGFFPLIAGVPTHEQAQRMINEHLLNEKEFFGEYIIPYISKNHPAISDTIDINSDAIQITGIMNFLVYLGLTNYELTEAKMILAAKSSNLLLKQWIKNRSVYQSYNSITGAGSDINQNNVLCTHGGLLALIALIEAGYW